MKKILWAISAISILILLGILSWRAIQIKKSFPKLNFGAKKPDFQFSEPASFPAKVLRADTQARAVFIADIESDYPIFEKKADKALPIASLTKIFTSLVVLTDYNLNQVLSVPPEAVNITGSKMHLLAGEKIKIEDLVWGMLVASANDAAKTLEIRLGPELVRKMNQLAQKLGLKKTKFVDAVGLSKENVSTARELFFAAKFAIKNPVFAKIVKTKEKDVMTVDGRVIHLKNTNRLVREKSEYWGIKTGYTEEARSCLVAGYNLKDKKIISVVLGVDNWFERFWETERLEGLINQKIGW